MTTTDKKNDLVLTTFLSRSGMSHTDIVRSFPMSVIWLFTLYCTVHETFVTSVSSPFGCEVPSVLNEVPTVS